MEIIPNAVNISELRQAGSRQPEPGSAPYALYLGKLATNKGTQYLVDVVTHEGEVLVVMEYVHGESLATLARAFSTRGEKMPVGMAVSIVVGALHGLHAAHEATTDHGEPLGIVPRRLGVTERGTSAAIVFGAIDICAAGWPPSLLEGNTLCVSVHE